MSEDAGYRYKYGNGASRQFSPKQKKSGVLTGLEKNLTQATFGRGKFPVKDE